MAYNNPPFSVPNRVPLPTRGTILWGLDLSTNEFKPVQLDSSGALVVNSGGGIVQPLSQSCTISSPATDTDYFLPESGSVDLSGYVQSTWYIYIPETTGMAVDACELQMSLDNSSFYTTAGYQIADADFSRGVWNSINSTQLMKYTRLRVRVSGAAPSRIVLALFAR